jgi:electron transport complex protein RnfE
MDRIRALFRDGFWTNNVGLVQLLGLCPLLAVTGNAINGLGLGLATLLVLLISNGLVSIIRNWVPSEIRIPVFVLIIASAVTAIELTFKALFYDLYLILGIFIPLIVTNCAIIGRAEAFASKNSLPNALVDAFAMGMGFLIFGEAARDWTIHLIDNYRDFLLAILPPGAFIALGLLIAGKNWLDQRRQAAATLAPSATANLATSTS